MARFTASPEIYRSSMCSCRICEQVNQVSHEFIEGRLNSGRSPTDPPLQPVCPPPSLLSSFRHSHHILFVFLSGASFSAPAEQLCSCRLVNIEDELWRKTPPACRPGGLKTMDTDGVWCLRSIILRRNMDCCLLCFDTFSTEVRWLCCHTSPPTIRLLVWTLDIVCHGRGEVYRKYKYTFFFFKCVWMFPVDDFCDWKEGNSLPTFLFATKSQHAYCGDFCYVPLITAHLFLGGWKVWTCWVQPIRLGTGSLTAWRKMLYSIHQSAPMNSTSRYQIVVRIGPIRGKKIQLIKSYFEKVLFWVTRRGWDLLLVLFMQPEKGTGTNIQRDASVRYGASAPLRT